MLARPQARHWLFPVVVAVHVLLIALLLLVRGPASKPDIKAVPVTLIDVAGPKEEVPVEPMQPVLQRRDIISPEPVVKLPATSEILAGPVFDLSAASAAGFGQSCEISESLGKAFQAHPGLRQALADWPSQARSVSGAIMLWDGAWVAPNAEMNPESLELIQRGVREGIRAAPEECLDEPIIGPRLVIVPSEDARNAILVLGSGNWAWRHILDHEDERLRAQASAAAAQTNRETAVPSQGTTRPVPGAAAPRSRSPISN